MVYLIIFLCMYLLSGIATAKVYCDIRKFVDGEIKKLAWKMNIDYEEMLDLFGADVSLNYKFFIPVLNYFNAMIEFGTMIINFTNFKSSVYEISPEFQYQESVEKQHDLEGDIKNKKEFFVGKTINGRAKNIYFDYDGKEINIKNYSASNYVDLSPDEQKEELLKLLCEWYYGGYQYLNGSRNISDVFDDKLANDVKNLYYQNFEYQVEFEEKLSRKR